MCAVRILIVDDHPVVLKGLRDIFCPFKDFRIVGEATRGRDGLELARQLVPDLIILDLRLPDMLAPEFCKELRLAGIATKVVILTAFDDKTLLDACLAEGATGIVLKDAHELELINMLSGILHGQLVIDKRLEKDLQFDKKTKNYCGITGREYEVLRLVAQGMSTREIAENLCLSVNTVRSYIQSLLIKLDANNRIEMLVAAKRLRII